MVAGVEIRFRNKPTDNEIHSMVLAAEKLTKDPSTVEILKSEDSPTTATAIFRMKNQAQYKVVDHVAYTFKQKMPPYSEMTIWFRQEKAYDLQRKAALLQE